MANNTISFSNARIMFRNFSGRQGKFNSDMSFCVVVPEDRAQKLINDGWNVRILAPREEGEAAIHYLPVAVKFNYYPPKIYLISGINGKKTVIDEDTVHKLDSYDFSNIDLIVRAYPWEVNGNSGIKAYLKTMYATLEEDEFAYKYAGIEDDEDEPLPFN